MVFSNYKKVGLELDKVINAHRDTRREGQRGTCMARAHDLTKNQRRRHGNLQKRISGHHERGAAENNSAVLPLAGTYVVNGRMVVCHGKSQKI